MSQTETLSFQAEVEELLGLMIHSLYSHKEIFLRELISNASDALDKLRFEALTRPELVAQDPRLCIRLDVDPAARRLRIIDNGIGMSRQELVDNLGTIARSGTRKFLEALRATGSEAPELIGQFGVGFYSSFMVAERITVETWRAGESGGTRWSSKGDGKFTLEELPGGARGTQIELELRPSADDEEAPDYADPALIRELVRKYSDFVEWPIEMAAQHFEGDGTLKRLTADDGVEVVVLNSRRPLWSRPKDEITAEEHAQFFRHLTHTWNDPLEAIHFKAEGATEYTALFYLPAERAFDLFDPTRDKSHVSLYVRRVFIMAHCEELLPPWLRFVHGVVDSSDLPLNVSRETLQHNRAMKQIKKRCTKKVLDALAAMQSARRADYEKFWTQFGAVLKEGIVVDEGEAQAIAALCLYASSTESAATTLDEYVARMKPGQDAIYVLPAADLDSARRSPLLETLTAKGWECLLWTDGIDEWVQGHLREYKSHKIVSIDRGEVDFASEAEKAVREQLERDFRAVLERLESELKPHVERVRFSARLKDTPAVLVDDEHSIGPQMERMMRQAGREPPKRQRVLELNADHPLTHKLRELVESGSAPDKLKDWSELLLGQALLAEGSPLPDPARFGKLVSELMLGAAR